ncbi:hypothetical protein N9Q43_00070 [bacterium]|nr:hypothetical protein [bacterium]
MAIYKLFPSQDASIYSAYPAMNTGLDPILDVFNTYPSTTPSPQVARSIIKFDQSEIEEVIGSIAKVDGQAGEWNQWSGSLKAYVAKATNVVLNSNLEIYPVSGSWNNGTGQYLDNKINGTGVSWVFQDYSGSRPWVQGGFPPLVTGSFSGSNNAGGGNWYTGSGGYQNINSLTASQNFNLRSPKDLNVDVTNILKVWYSSSKDINQGLIEISNEGFMIKWEDSKEFVTESAITPQLSFYSVDTNTIYPPQLEIKWRDYSYSTSSGDFKFGRTLTGSYPTNELTSSISCSFTQSLPTPNSNTGTGTGATFGATFNGASMLNVFVKELGLGYKEGDILQWDAATINALPSTSGAITNAVTTLSTFDITQLPVLSTPDVFVALDNNQGVFYSESINQFRINSRPLFPTRTFTTESAYTLNYALPSSSYYAIKDLDTNEYVVEFDEEFTQISCDSTGSFFTIYMNGLEPERYYNILIKTVVDKQTIVSDENYYFKVING